MAEVRYRSYVLCCGGTSCSENGSQNVISAFNEELRVNHLDREVKLVITGCQGLCEVGPIVAVYPHDLLYC
ncbi:TPA: (2Fe-2S) ferredoxin domain-containing protein, partial [Candidatus Poribacteria bacterium]|nr:(2Fe-2S) ferredoxin domain-containing protein [Candidatus Poribacteria bacterium]HEX29030.1 (2Fe-2S) ferredoxin domain-containing protein [Candidatus Poribacteria bacterium]